MKPRYSIIPGGFARDQRCDLHHFRIMNFLGEHTDEDGWCRLKQNNIGKAVGLTRETVNRKLIDLVEWCYVAKHAEDATGRAIWYRVIMDRPFSQSREQTDPSGPVSHGSHVEYNTGAELHPTCDPPLTPGVSAEDHTRCDRIGSQQERPFFNDQDSPPAPQGGKGEGEEVQLWIKEETEGCPHVRPALTRILDVIPIQHPKPRALIAEVVEGLKAYPSNVLDAAAGDIVRNRKKLVAPKCVLEAAAKACAAAPIVRIQAGDASYQAWERWHTLRGAKVIVSMARTHGFSERSLWPPGWSGVAPSDSPPASRPEGAASHGGRPSGRGPEHKLAERESPSEKMGASP